MNEELLEIKQMLEDFDKASNIKFRLDTLNDFYNINTNIMKDLEDCIDNYHYDDYLKFKFDMIIEYFKS